jgi:flagellar hook assembly protein FlgD
VFRLAPNYPNPFNPSATIEFELSARSHVSARIFNVRGQHVRTLLEGERPAGPHVIQWDGRGDAGEPLSSGVYFLRVAVTSGRGAMQSKTAKLVLLK